ncbi:uncharacterized protein LOC142356186, partial [Convolutriloba macropyga]|uniref:uncharacterized protein LOC142356186 n=1 Tax=Convolutriloba macropyga TaxID=536237 RepID=UPI003F52247B
MLKTTAMTLRLKVTILITLVTLVTAVSPPDQTSANVEQTEEEQEGDFHGLEVTNRILRWVVFPLIVFFAASCNYFIIFTVFDLGLDRACKVLMGSVAVTDFIQIFSIIYVKAWALSTFGCKSSVFMSFFASHLTQNQLAIFNVDRFVALTRHIWYAQNLMHNIYYCRVAFILNIVLSALLNIPTVFVSYYDPILNRCTVQDNATVSPFIMPVLGIWAVFYIAVPLLVIIPTNIYISTKL